MTPEHDPLETPKGSNAYDPLFAQRIEALGKGSTPAPTPPKPTGSGGGTWPVYLIIVVAVAIMRVASSSSSYQSKVPEIPQVDFNRFNDNLRHMEAQNEQLMRQQKLIELATRPQPLADGERSAELLLESLQRLEMPMDPVEQQERLRKIVLLRQQLERQKKLRELREKLP